MAKLTKEQKERIKEFALLTMDIHLTALDGLGRLYAMESDPEKCKKIQETWENLQETWKKQYGDR